MKILYRSLIVLFLTFLSATHAHAERKPEDRKEATHVVVGQVTGVFESDVGESIRRVVRLRIESINKGDGLAVGRYFYVECSKRKSRKGPGALAPGASGHKGVPKVGDRVRVFTNDRKGIYEGVYPDWFDVLPKPDK